MLHVQSWLARVDEVVQPGKDAYLADDLLQETGDSLMRKLGEAANRLSRLGVLAPDGVECALAVAHRNCTMQQYDETNRELTWVTWRDGARRSLRPECGDSRLYTEEDIARFSSGQSRNS